MTLTLSAGEFNLTWNCYIPITKTLPGWFSDSMPQCVLESELSIYIDFPGLILPLLIAPQWLNPQT